MSTNTTTATAILSRKAWSADAAAAIYNVTADVAALPESDQAGHLAAIRDRYKLRAEKADKAMQMILSDDDWDGDHTILAALESSRDRSQIAANLLRKIIEGAQE